MSKTILLSLIGAEPTGNYRAYKEFEANVVIHVYSDKTEIISERILSLISKEIKKDIEIVRINVIGDNYLSINNKLNQIKFDFIQDDYIYINVTGGTKMMCIAAIDFGKSLESKCNVSFFYTDISTQKIHWFYENKHDTFCEELKLEEIIQLRGQKIKSKETYNDVYQIFKHAIQEIEDLNYNISTNEIWKSFLKLIVAKIRDEASIDRNKGKSTYDLFKYYTTNSFNSHFEVLWTNKQFQVSKNGVEIIKLENSIAEIDWFIFNGGWFELQVAKYLARKHNANNIFMNVKFPVLKDFILDKNEVDILINENGKLLFIECKSGIVKPENVNSIKIREETYGGSIGQSMLIIQHELKTNDTSTVIIEKCKELNIAIKTIQQLKNENNTCIIN